jgi:phenylpropionate dioxygenase-like ring-hydroxylating dioxygenase large terminal subunit
MFLKNAWYCAGWAHELTMAKDDLQVRRIADEDILLYRQPDATVVALEDRCCHRQAALSCGRKEGGEIRCMYHGWKFDGAGSCTEIPGQSAIPDRARIRAFPVVERNGWIWLWMGEADKADPSLICFSVGPDHPDWNIKTSRMEMNANYRLEIANLADLTHLAWTHDKTFGGTTAYATTRMDYRLTPRGLDYDFWLRNAPAFRVFEHLFPADARFDIHFDVQMTLPCNFVIRFRVFTAGTATEGASDGQLLLDTYSCQAITPRDADWVDYYFSWGTSKATALPNMTESLMAWITEAFLEDKLTLEAQHKRMKAKPDFRMVDYAYDAGPGKMLWLLDKMLKDEARTSGVTAVAAA